jgi:type III secretion system low calcium response chaperone LcrH/SycD
MPHAAVMNSFATLRAELEKLPSAKRLTQTDTEAIFSIAYSLIAQGHFVDALKYFAVLTLYRPTDAKYQAGLGLCFQTIGCYDEAIGNFAFAASLEPDNPQYMLSIAECELQKRDFATARATLEMVARYCKETGRFDEAGQRAESMLALLAAGGEKPA